MIGKIIYLNKMKMKDPSLVRCPGDCERTIISCYTNSLPVHTLVYEVERCSYFPLTLPSSPMLTWVPNVMRVRSFQRERALMCLYHSHVAELSRRSSQRFEQVTGDTTALPSLCNKGGPQPSSAKCEENTGRKKVPFI